MSAPTSRLKSWFVPNDIDGFFGLFVDNLCQLIVIVTLCPLIAGLPISLVVGRILPGIAVSLVAGNLFYAWQARRLSQQTGKPVTALPFGVNTVSLFALIFLILGPVYHESHGNSELAWKVSLAAGFLGGLIEIGASFVADWVRRNTPRAALLSTLAGVAITFISMGFILRIFNSPLIALFPALLVLIGYAGRIRWPFGMPTGFIAVVIGAAAMWLLRGFHLSPMPEWPQSHLELVLPVPIVGEIFSLMVDPQVWKYSAIFIPMAVLNVIGSIQNLESAEAAGDKFPTRSSLLVNGSSAVIGVFFGNPFAPTIYIGHPGWKAMGARAGYSVMNAVAITLVCLTGAMPFLLYYIPIEATLGILLWIGLIITSQAFQEVPKAHAPAVAIGFIPALANWGLFLVQTTLQAAAPGYTLEKAATSIGTDSFAVVGAICLTQGFMFISIFFSAILAMVIDRRWRAAAIWCLIASAASACGIIHAFVFTPDGFAPAYFQWTGMAAGIPSGFDFAFIYFAAAMLLFIMHAFKPGEVEH